MIRTAILFYIIIYSLYTVFTRRPDYFDGTIIPATIQFNTEVHTQKKLPFAHYLASGKMYAVDASYLFRNYHSGEQVQVIYEASNPAQAGIYSWWGYWLRWQEIIPSLLIYSILFYAAFSISKKEAGDTIIETEKAYRKKKKYAD